MVIYRDGSSRAAVVQPLLVYRLFSYAECGKNAVQDVIGRSGTGNGIDGPQSGIKVHQQHFVRDAERYRAASVLKSFERFFEQILMPQAGDAAAFGRGQPLGSKAAQDFAAQLLDAVAGFG